MADKSFIYVVYHVDCRLCDYQEYLDYVPSKRWAARVLRGEGWSNTNEHGWICGTCARIKKEMKHDDQR